MKIKGKIQKIDKEYQSVVKSRTYGISTDYQNSNADYLYYLVIGEERYYYSNKQLTDKTKIGDDFILISNSKNEIMAWENLTKNYRSNYTIFHIIFHSNIIVAASVIAMFWYLAKDNQEIVNKIFLIGIPCLIVTAIYSFIIGSKRLIAQRKLNK